MTRMITASQLNMSWTVAHAKALLNSSLSAICVKETIVLVTEVPMLAPMIIGMAVFTGTFAATNPTMMEVDVELDWTKTVTSTPIITPTTGLFNRSEFSNKARNNNMLQVKVQLFKCLKIPPRFLPPIILNESDKNEREQMKKYKQVMRRIIFTATTTASFTLDMMDAPCRTEHSFHFSSTFIHRQRTH